MRSIGILVVCVIFLCFVNANASPKKLQRQGAGCKKSKDFKQFIEKQRKRCADIMIKKGKGHGEATKRWMGYGGYGYGYPGGFGGYGYPFDYPGCDMMGGSWFGGGYGWGGPGGWGGGWPGGFGGGWGGGWPGGYGGGCGCGCGGCCGGNCCGGFHCPHWCCCGKDKEGEGEGEGGGEGEDKAGGEGDGGTEDGPEGGAEGEAKQDKPLGKAAAQSKLADQISVQVKPVNQNPAVQAAVKPKPVV